MLLKRIFAVIVILIATIAFLANAAGLVGVWVLRQPARDTVTTLSTLLNDKLGKVDDTLARVNSRAGEAREALVRINNAANQVGDRLENNSPLLTKLVDAARDDLAPKVGELRAQAAMLHDTAISVNAALETLNDLQLVTVPTFSEELSAVSGRIDAIQEDVQELRAGVEQARTSASASLIAAVTAKTDKIDKVIAQVQFTAAKYQEIVTQKRQQVADRTSTLVSMINLVAVSLTVLFLVIAAGQVLLIRVVARSMTKTPTSTGMPTLAPTSPLG